jgi:cell division protein FtsB
VVSIKDESDNLDYGLLEKDQTPEEIDLEYEENEAIKQERNEIFEEIKYLYTSYMTKKHELEYEAKKKELPFDLLDFAKQKEFF